MPKLVTVLSSTNWLLVIVGFTLAFAFAFIFDTSGLTTRQEEWKKTNNVESISCPRGIGDYTKYPLESVKKVCLVAMK